MKLTNSEMLEKMESLTDFLDRNDLIGYSAARNYRRLSDASMEYSKKQREAMSKYGEQEFDKDGNQTGNMVIQIGSENFKKFQQFLYPYAMIEHDVIIFKIPYSEVIGKLTGSEILKIDWMLEDSDKPADD